MHYRTCCKSSASSFEGMQVNKSTCSQCKIAHKTYCISFNYPIMLCIKVLKHPQPLPQCSVVYDNLIHCNLCRYSNICIQRSTNIVYHVLMEYKYIAPFHPPSPSCSVMYGSYSFATLMQCTTLLWDASYVFLSALPNEHLLMCTSGSKWICAQSSHRASNQCQFPWFAQKIHPHYVVSNLILGIKRSVPLPY